MNKHSSSKKLQAVTLLLLFLFGSQLAPLASPTAYQDTDLSSAIFKSTDSGATWSVVNSGLPCLKVFSIVADPLTPGTVYAGTERGVFKSTDGGEHWIAPNGIITLGSFLPVIQPDSSSIVYAAGSGIEGGSQGVLKSTDAGASWRAMNVGLRKTHAGDLIIDPANPSTLYVVSHRAIHKSTDGGGHWNDVRPFFTGGDVAYSKDLEIDPLKPSSLYGIDGFEYLKSTDAGVTWKVSSLSFNALTLNVDPSDPSFQYIIPNPANKVYRSTDGGNSWASIIESPSDWFGGGLMIDPVNPSTLFLGTQQGILKSADRGLNWVKTDYPGAGPTRLFFDPVTPSTVYASNGQGRLPTDTPWINALYIQGKQLIVRGQFFDDGAAILINGEEQTTKNSGVEPTFVLICKKAGKKIKKDPTLKIQVRNSDGKLSQEAAFFSPVE